MLSAVTVKGFTSCYISVSGERDFAAALGITACVYNTHLMIVHVGDTSVRFSAVDYKKAVHTVKKASSDTVRLQKKANKGVLS